MGDNSLKSYIVTPEVNEDAFVSRLFEELPSRSRWPTRLAAAAAILIVAGTGVAVWSRSTHTLAPGTTVKTASTEVTVALGTDGSTFTLDPKSQAQLVAIAPADVVIQLVNGRASFKVSHNPARSFRVVAGTTEVRVHGTQFAVERVGESAIVSVTEGVVEVREHGQFVMNLTASQKYTSGVGSGDSAGPVVAQAAPLDAVEPENELDVSENQDPAPSDVAKPPKRHQSTHRSTTRGGGAPSKGAVQAAPDEDAKAAPTADQLFDEVREERRLGHYAKAATMLSELLAKHPNSAQEGLAAFELGRLRMDQLNDVEGAIAPLVLAQTKLPSAPLREDVAARLVRAYQVTKRISACEEARSEYLQRFPSGIHRPTVELLCPPAVTP